MSQTGRQPLFDPMCGSGTLVIEAAQQAMQIAPGLSRRTFGFQRWPEFDGKAWSKAVDAARKQKLSAAPCEIIASDVDPDPRFAGRRHNRISFSSSADL